MNTPRLPLILAALLVGTCLSQAARAESASVQLPALSPLGAPIAITAEYDITVRPDRTVQKIVTMKVKVQVEAAIKTAGQQRLTYVEGMEDLTILEAYTQKADGRRVDVDPSTIITSDAASGTALMFMRDQKQRTAIFPDLEVGDTVVLKAAYDKKQDFFPGQFADQFLFARSAPLREGVVRITVPKSVPASVAVTGDELSRSVIETATDTRYVVTYRPRGMMSDAPGSVSAWDRDAHVLLSSFKDYAELGAAYWREAAPRAAVTPEIQALADTITRGLDTRRAQAEAIDQWVKRNIRYVALYMGAGRWTPHDAATVLKTRYGDCKDHAILMTALLAAKGIASEQVLVNQGDAYSLPELPAKAVLNHAIVYLPEFDLYDDPTTSLAAFGVLSPNIYGKPVVHGGPDGGRVGHTPAMNPNEHTTFNRTVIKVAADGTMKGETTQTATGAFATGLRVAAVDAQEKGFETAIESLLRSWGAPGRGTMEIGPLTNLSGPYQVKVNFAYDRPYGVPLTGTRLIPFGAPVQKRPGDFLLNVRRDNRKVGFQCYSGREIEEISMTFADGLPLPQKITGRTIDNPIFTYTSSYRMEGRTFTVRREFTAHVPSPVCAPELETALADDFKMVRGSMGTSLTFNPPVASSKQVRRTAGLN